MWKFTFFAAFLAVSVVGFVHAAINQTDFTALESKWIKNIDPVVRYGLEQKLKITVAVNVNVKNGISPIGIDTSCKFILNFRDNKAALDLEDSIPDEIYKPVSEAIAAHELAHCWRSINGLYGVLPPGIMDTASLDDEKVKKIRLERREEGFADLVGLAWVQSRYSAQTYAEVLEWFKEFRSDPDYSGDSHDTRVWLELAGDMKIDKNTPIFEQVMPRWRSGLLVKANKN